MLINCPECGGKISDKAPACIHCGYPLNLLDKHSQENNISEIELSKENIPKEDGYSLELLDYGNKKIQISMALKNILKIESSEALSLVESTPCYLFKGEQEQTALSLVKKLDSFPVEYNLYLDGKLKKHKPKSNIISQNTRRFNTYTKKIKCPNCLSLTPETSAKCVVCGFDGIRSYLLQLQSENKTQIGYNHKEENRSTEIKIRCLSDDRKVKYMIFLSNGSELARVPIGAVATINITRPTRLTIRESYIFLTTGDNGSFEAIPGKCYEARFCKPGLAFWDTVVSEVSFIS